MRGEERNTRSYRLTPETDRKLRELKDMRPGQSFSSVVERAVDLLYAQEFQQPEARLGRLESAVEAGFTEVRSENAALRSELADLRRRLEERAA